MKHLRTTAAPIAVLLMAWVLLTRNLGVRWFGHQDANGILWGASVRNFQFYGAWNLRLAQVTNPGPATPSTYHIYTHHPPLITWLIAVASIPQGFSEATMRFVTASATLIGIAAIYVLCRRLYNARTASLAMAFYALTPMIAYYGRMPNHEALTLAICLTYATVLVNWLRRPTQGQLISLALLAALSVWTSWAAMLYIALFLALAMWKGSLRQRVGTIGIGGVFATSLVGLTALTLWQRPDALQDLVDTFVWRTSTDSFTEGTAPFTLPQYIMTVGRHLLTLATPSLLILAAIGAKPAMQRQRTFSKVTLGALLAHGVVYMLVLRNASYIHDYYKIYLIPPLAILGAIGFARMWDRGRMHRWNRPALSGLLLAWFLTGSYVLITLHQSANAPEAEFMIEAFSENTDQDDEISTNLSYVTDAVSYYSFRNIAWETPPQEAFGSKYLFCPTKTSSELPDALKSYPAHAIPPCTMVTLHR